MSASRPSLSFIIPVRNDAMRLRRCLRSIVETMPAGGAVEIIVADNGSTDDSASVARDAGATVLDLPGLRLGDLRNRAAAAAAGDLLAFVDADHEIGAGWIGCAIDVMHMSQVGGIGAPYDPPAPATWVQRLYDRLRRHPTSREAVDWLGSGNMAVRRAAFEQVGGFDTTLETCEDVDLCRKLRGHGYTLLADRRMSSVHYGNPGTLGQVFLGELWRGRDNIRVSLRPPRASRTLVSAAMPVANLAAAAMVLGGLLGGQPSGVIYATAGLTYLVLVIGLRASVMTRHSRIADWPKACLVAAAYEAGRALALTGPFGYRRRRRAAA